MISPGECVAAVDLGGTKIAAALVDADGTVLVHRQMPTDAHRGPGAVIADMGSLVARLADEIKRRPAALGLGVPGLADVGAGVTKFLPNLPTQWRDVPVRELLSPLVRCPVHVLNDARCATLGELKFGHGRDEAAVNTMLFFTLGTGIGGGVVIDRKLRLGRLGAAGELGHQTIVPDGPACSCGSRGCMETLASGPAIAGEGVRLMRSGQAPRLHEITGGDDARVSAATMNDAARAGDVPVAAALERIGQYIGIGVANLVVALHPDLVVLGGGVSALGETLLRPIRETVRRGASLVPTDGIRFEVSQLGEKAGLLGAAALALMGGMQPQ
jgi:glucokinase